MHAPLTHFLKTFSADQPVLWALLVMGVLAAMSLGLYVFWEVALSFLGRAIFPRRSGSPDASGQPSRE